MQILRTHPGLKHWKLWRASRGWFLTSPGWFWCMLKFGNRWFRTRTTVYPLLEHVSVFQNLPQLKGLPWASTQTFLINYLKFFQDFLRLPSKVLNHRTWGPEGTFRRVLISFLHAPPWTLSVRRFQNKRRKAIRWKLSGRNSVNLLVTIFYSVPHPVSEVWVTLLLQFEA